MGLGTAARTVVSSTACPIFSPEDSLRGGEDAEANLKEPLEGLANRWRIYTFHYKAGSGTIDLYVHNTSDLNNLILNLIKLKGAFSITNYTNF